MENRFNLLFIVWILFSCSPESTTEESLETQYTLNQETESKNFSLYVFSTTGSTGKITELRKIGNQIYSKTIIENSPSDVVLKKISDSKISFINRFQGESFQIYDLNEENLVNDHSFSQNQVDFLNPQDIISPLRDEYWISFQNLNAVRIYENVQNNSFFQIDFSHLSKFKDEDNFFEAGNLFEINDDEVLLLLQRLNRSNNSWEPSKKSGYVIFSKINRSITSHGFISVSNPIFASIQETGNLKFYGTGSYFNPSNLGSTSVLSSRNKKEQVERYNFNILEVFEDFQMTWNQEKNEYCIRKNLRNHWCKTPNLGEYYSSFRVVGNTLIVTLNFEKGSKLLFYDFKTSLISLSIDDFEGRIFDIETL